MAPHVDFLGVLFIVWGTAHVIVGASLRLRRPWSRIMALVLGSVDLVLLPYGTALGIYAMWVLLTEQTKMMFVVASR